MRNSSKQWVAANESDLSSTGGKGRPPDSGLLRGRSRIRLADRFFADLLLTIGCALAEPRRFPPAGEGMRRANLKDFPYHFLFEEKPWGIKVTVVRHHRRNPRYGMRRQ